MFFFSSRPLSEAGKNGCCSLPLAMPCLNAKLLSAVSSQRTKLDIITRVTLSSRCASWWDKTPNDRWKSIICGTIFVIIDWPISINIDWSIGFPMIDCHRFNTPGFEPASEIKERTNSYWSLKILRHELNDAGNILSVYVLQQVRYFWLVLLQLPIVI